MIKCLIAVTGLAFALTLLSETAMACSCAGAPTPCAAFRSTPIVFAGLVVSIDERKTEISRLGETGTIRTGLVAHFAVEESFKGIGSKEVDVATGGGHGDCGFDFRVGERYLVYAYPTEGEALESAVARTVTGDPQEPSRPGRLQTNICTRTDQLSRAQDDVELIRALIAGKPQTRIFGTVSEAVRKLGTYEYDIDPIGPVVGTAIIVEGEKGKFETRTDSAGHFVIKDPPPGTYAVRLVYPPHYGPLFPFGNVDSVEVTREDCSAEANYTLQVDGRIGGRVFEGESKVVNRQVQVSIVSLATADNAIPLVESRSEYTDEQGRYEFDGVPPGTYLLGVSIADVPSKNTPYSRTYYPNSSDRSAAMTIRLEKGQKLTEMDFHLSPRLAERSLTGVVLLANGKPASGADVRIYDIDDPEDRVFGFDAETDAQGRFTIPCLSGRRYRVHAYLSEDYLAGTGVQSIPLEVDSASDARPLTLVLSQPGIFLRQLKPAVKK